MANLGILSRSSLAATSPLITGMLMFNTRTSGFVISHTCIACAPSAASPHTSNLTFRSNISHTSLLIASWSSAMTILIVRCCFAVCPTSHRKTTASRYLSGRLGSFNRQVCYRAAELSRVSRKQYSQAGTIRMNFSYLGKQPWTAEQNSHLRQTETEGVWPLHACSEHRHLRARRRPYSPCQEQLVS
jgi:hypothetical protein